MSRSRRVPYALAHDAASRLLDEQRSRSGVDRPARLRRHAQRDGVLRRHGCRCGRGLAVHRRSLPLSGHQAAARARARARRRARPRPAGVHHAVRRGARGARDDGVGRHRARAVRGERVLSGARRTRGALQLHLGCGLRHPARAERRHRRPQPHRRLGDDHEGLLLGRRGDARGSGRLLLPHRGPRDQPRALRAQVGAPRTWTG